MCLVGFGKITLNVSSSYFVLIFKSDIAYSLLRIIDSCLRLSYTAFYLSLFATFDWLGE